MFSHKVPWWGTVHKTLCWLGCGFALSGPSTSVELCGKPLESRCPPCRYITHHGAGVWCHSHNSECGVPHRNQRRPNPVQQLLKHEREEEDREERKRLGAIAGIVCVCVCASPCVCASVRTCVCMWVHYQLAEDRRPHVFFVCPVNIPSTERRMETDALRCSSAFFQTSSHTHTHTHKGNYHALLPRVCQSTPHSPLKLTHWLMVKGLENS